MPTTVFFFFTCYICKIQNKKIQKRKGNIDPNKALGVGCCIENIALFDPPVVGPVNKCSDCREALSLLISLALLWLSITSFSRTYEGYDEYDPANTYQKTQLFNCLLFKYVF